MELNLYIKEGEQLKTLKVPPYVVKDLLRDRLSKSEIERIHRFAEKTRQPVAFKPGSVVVDFAARKARCFEARLNVADLEPMWEVKVGGWPAYGEKSAGARFRETPSRDTSEVREALQERAQKARFR